MLIATPQVVCLGSGKTKGAGFLRSDNHIWGDDIMVSGCKSVTWLIALRVVRIVYYRTIFLGRPAVSKNFALLLVLLSVPEVAL